MSPDPRQPINKVPELHQRVRFVNVSYLCSSVVAVPEITGTPKVAQQRPVCLISGAGITSGLGQVTLPINEFLNLPSCLEPKFLHLGPAITHPGVFVATPLGDTPAVLAYTADEKILGGVSYLYADFFKAELRILQGGVREWTVAISVRSWDLNGDPAPSVRFSWIYVAEAAVRIEPPA